MCLSVLSVFYFYFLMFNPVAHSHRRTAAFPQFELQHFSQICQQCVLKSLSVGSRSPWTQLSSIFTVWGLTGSKRGPFQHLLTSVPVGRETLLLSHHFHTELIKELHPLTQTFSESCHYKLFPCCSISLTNTIHCVHACFYFFNERWKR